MKFAIILILLCASFGFSCHQEAKEISLELAMIDSIMWDHPDSALTLLEKMPKPSPSDKLMMLHGACFIRKRGIRIIRNIPRTR